MKINLPPSNDLIFSCVFRDMSAANAMLSLVNAIRQDKNKEPFDSIVELKSQYTQLGKTAEHKYGRLDVRAKAMDGSLINIEMQADSKDDMNQRMTYYAANMISELKIGEMYHSVPKTEMIIIEGEKTKANDDGRYHHSYSMRDDEQPHEQVSAWVGLHKLSLTTFALNEFDPSNKLHWWLAYLGGKYKDEDFVKEACKVDSGILQFAEKYNLSLNDPDIMDSYSFYKSSQLEFNSGMYASEQKGLQEGLQKGLQKGRQDELRDVIISMHKMGMSGFQIKALAHERGMPGDEADSIIKEIQAHTKRKPQEQSI